MKAIVRDILEAELKQLTMLIISDPQWLMRLSIPGMFENARVPEIVAKSTTLCIKKDGRRQMDSFVIQYVA